MTRSLLLGSTALAALLFTPVAHAEASLTCTKGLVLDVADADADAIVATTCAAARARSAKGELRVSVVRTGASIAVSVAHIADASGVERTARKQASDIPSAKTAGEAATESLFGRPVIAGVIANVNEPVPVSEPPRSVPDPTTTSAEVPSAAELPPPPDKADAPKPKPESRTHFPLGVQTAVISAGGNAPPSLGGGVSVGVEHDRVLAYVDYTYSAGKKSGETFEHHMASLVVRMYLGKAKVLPFLGGGYIYTSHTNVGSTSSYCTSLASSYGCGNMVTGIDLVGEGGVTWKLDEHQRLSLAGRLAPLGDESLAGANVSYSYGF